MDSYEIWSRCLGWISKGYGFSGTAFTSWMTKYMKDLFLVSSLSKNCESLEKAQQFDATILKKLIWFHFSLQSACEAGVVSSDEFEYAQGMDVEFPDFLRREILN